MSRSATSAAQSPTLPLSIFCAAAPADETLLAQWETYLLPLQQARQISCWSFRHLTAGADAEQERISHLASADLILLLLSADFFASEECLAIMQQALARQQAGSARVIPLLLRPVEWQETELAALTPLPTNGLPVTHGPRKMRRGIAASSACNLSFGSAAQPLSLHFHPSKRSAEPLLTANACLVVYGKPTRNCWTIPYMASPGWNWDSPASRTLYVINSLTWSPDSTHIASASNDKTVQVWRV